MDPRTTRHGGGAAPTPIGRGPLPPPVPTTTAADDATTSLIPRPSDDGSGTTSVLRPEDVDRAASADSATTSVIRPGRQQGSGPRRPPLRRRPVPPIADERAATSWLRFESASSAGPPVFVDGSGRRRTLWRVVGALVVVVCLVFLAVLVVAAVAGSPGIPGLHALPATSATSGSSSGS